MRPDPPGSPASNPRWPRRRRLFVTATLAGALAAVWLAGGIHAHAEITVSVDGFPQTLKTRARTVSEALLTAGVSLDPRDSVEPDRDAPVTGGMTIQVRRARAMRLSLDGRDLQLRTTASTVGEALALSRLVIRPGDRLTPGSDEPVVDGLRVTVTRVVRSYRHHGEPIPLSTVRIDDMSMDLGQEVVDKPGEDGLLQRLLLLTYEDGRQVSAEELSNEVLREPTTRVVRVGTAGSIVRDSQTIRFLKRMDVTATAYEPGPISCGAYSDGYTALGLRATRGIIAVDPTVIPFWTKVYVDGYGFAVAGDRGSAIIGDRIDVCYDTYAEAMAWGVRRVRLYILELPGT